MSTINDRIKAVMEHYNYNSRSFAKHIGVDHATIYVIVTGKTKWPSSKTLVKIIEAFPDMSLEWFFRESGNMLISGETNMQEQMKNVLKRLEALEKKRP